MTPSSFQARVLTSLTLGCLQPDFGGSAPWDPLTGAFRGGGPSGGSAPPAPPSIRAFGAPGAPVGGSVRGCGDSIEAARAGGG
eukprot:4322819-Alexandrium_andersonii.AAC.1